MMKITDLYISHAKKTHFVVRRISTLKSNIIYRLLNNISTEKIPDCTELSSAPGSCFKKIGEGNFQDGVDQCNVLKGTMPSATSLDTTQQIVGLENNGGIWAGLTTGNGE